MKNFSNWLVLSLAIGALPFNSDGVSFNNDIRPILADRCFACHGFDEQAREAGLRLDVRDAAVAKAESGETVIVPSDATASALIARVSSEDADVRMPPGDAGDRLTPGEIATLTKWIDQGAEYRKHWSFEPPLDAAPPIVAGVDHPIDRFIRRSTQPSTLRSKSTHVKKLSRRR